MYNIGKSSITLAKVTNPEQINFKDGDFDKIETFIQAIKNKNVPFLLSSIDQESLIDYLFFQSFIANWDWPYNNVRFYSTPSAKWRFCMFDLDWSNTEHLKKKLGYLIHSHLSFFLSLLLYRFSCKSIPVIG